MSTPTVELIDFPPHTEIFVDPDSTDPTDANGHVVFDQFAYHDVGETVHVNAHLNGELIRSNDLLWEAG